MVISNNARQRTVILPIICVALFLSVLNASALGVMLPDIAAGLSVDSGQLGWIMTGFLLVFGIAIPSTAGWLTVTARNRCSSWG